MGKKAEYRSAIRSRRLIRQAIVELLQEKNFEEISVTEIVTRADINRGTFYAHYQDTSAVMEEIENEITEKILEFLGEFRGKNFFQNPQPFLLQLSRWLEEDLGFYRMLMNLRGPGYRRFFEKLKHIIVEYMESDSDIPEHIKKTPEFFIRTHFLAGGIINLYQVWFRGEKNLSLHEIALEVSKIITINFGEVGNKER